MVGLAPVPVSWRELGLGDDAVLAQGAAAERADLADTLDELRTAAQLAVVDGRSGRHDRGRPSGRAPAPALPADRRPARGARLRKAVGEPELVRTLDALMAHDFDRARTSAALPVHRNTLTNRLNRIAAITELDVDSADGRGLLWLAWLGRR